MLRFVTGPFMFIGNLFSSVYQWLFPTKEPEIQLTPIKFEQSVIKPLNKQRIPNHFNLPPLYRYTPTNVQRRKVHFRPSWDGRNVIFDE